MNLPLRPLPLAIGLMTLLIATKAVGLLHAVNIGTPARASTEVSEPKAEQRAAAKPAQPPAALPPPATPAVQCEPQIGDAERNLLQDLRSRRDQLEARSAKLDERDAVLGAAERRLADRVQQLSVLQGKLEQLEKQRHERDEANWQGLVKTYESMRPRDAATIFNDLDGAVLLPVLDRMKSGKAAPILAAMTPERARTVTAQLAELRASSANTARDGAK